MILWKFVTSYIIVDERHVKNGTMYLEIFTLISSAFRNIVAKLHLHWLYCSGGINDDVLKLWLLRDLQAVHYRSAAMLETVTK
jgi:hypothetical protein